MRLICPRCGAQYEIDDSAIPAAGRDVECSACDHVWRAARPGPASEPAAPFDPAARPALSRPLSDSVIEILREEAARELEARAAERQAERAATANGRQPDDNAPAADAFPAAQPPAAPPPDAPGPAAGPAIPAAPQPGGAGPQPAPSSGEAAATAARAAARPEPRLHILSAESDAPRPETARPDAVRPDAAPGAAAQRPMPAHPATRATDGTVRARARHDAGYHLAVMVALVALALYALAPRLAGQGEIGARLMDWRAQVDHGRDWLDARADGLIGRGGGEGSAATR